MLCEEGEGRSDSEFEVGAVDYLDRVVRLRGSEASASALGRPWMMMEKAESTSAGNINDHRESILFLQPLRRLKLPSSAEAIITPATPYIHPLNAI